MSDTASTTIQLTVNGETRTTEAVVSVSDFLVSHDLDPDLVVVERNGEILERAAFERTLLEAEDTLEIVHFVGGG